MYSTTFKSFLIKQLSLHPLMQPQDIVKMCFQAAFGAEHLLQNIEGARNYFNREYDSVKPHDGLLYEMLSEDVCRINLSVWKYKNLPSKWLFQMFVASSSVVLEEGINKNALFLEYLEIAKTIFPQKELSHFLEEYEKKEISPVHHSETYRTAYAPAYRIVRCRFLRLLPILEKVAQMEQPTDSVKVIAIDGRAASGKSTMAEDLRMILDCDTIKIDHFFLPPALRSTNRFLETGGNVHYERFIGEVLPFIRNKQAFSYRRFDCSLMNYHGEVKISNTNWRIVEGSYSQHPLFGRYADIAVFSDITSDEQMKRIVKRNGMHMAKRFEKEWIPMEEQYFKEFEIQEKADMIV